MTQADLTPDATTAASREDWTALVRKTLKGGDPDRLTRRTADGLTIAPLHESAADAAPLPARRAFDPSRPWDVRARLTHPDPAVANRQALTDLEGGAASLLLVADPDGARGVALGSAADMRRVLNGVLLDLAPVALDARAFGPTAAEWLAEAAADVPAAPLAFHLDPLTAFAEQSASRVEAQVEQAAATAVRLADAFPNASLFLATGAVVHESGGSETLELGFALASALACAKALDAAGLPPEQAFGRIVLGVAVDAEPMLNIAKLRAARRVWARLVAACGSDAPAVIEARSSRRMLARLDAWTNLLRLTAAGFGAAAGGADAVVLGAFTDALGEPTDFARRQARNTQLVLMEEAHLGRVADPAAGSGLVEALTDQLAREAWRVFQTIEGRGGAAAALQDGWIAGEVARTRAARQADYARRKAGLIGVTEFPDLLGAPVEVAPVTRPAAQPPAAAGLAPIRWSEPFESLRDRGGAVTAKAGLLLLGPPAEHAARAGFARTLLGVGGIGTEAVSADAAAPLLILCGSDERYEAEAEAAARAAKSSGVRRVWLAGRPGEREAALRSAGVDRFIAMGDDATAVIEDALSALASA